MEALTLEVQKREITGSRVKNLRTEGVLPGVVYGGGSDATSISLDRGFFEKFYKIAGDSTLIDLTVGEDKPVKVLIHDIQRDPLYDVIRHVDFRQVDMKKELEADVELSYIGEAPAVKSHGGVLVKSMDSVKVSCLPDALVSTIEVDLGVIEEVGSAIRVSDLKAPEGIIFKTMATDIVAIVNAPISEEAIAALDEEVTENVDAVKVEGAEKKEGEDAASASEEKKS